MFQKIRHYIDHYQTRPRLNEFWGNFSQVYRGDNHTIPRFSCKDRLTSDIVILDVYFSKPFAKKLQRSMVASFTDKLASIGKCLTLNCNSVAYFPFSGGTLGLFCGISILSIAEIFICLFHTVHRLALRI